MRGLTQPELAEKAEIEQSYLSKLENGHSHRPKQYAIDWRKRCCDSGLPGTTLEEVKLSEHGRFEIIITGEKALLPVPSEE